MFDNLSLRHMLTTPAWIDQVLKWWLAEIRGLFSPDLLNRLSVPQYEHLLEFDGDTLRIKDSQSVECAVLPDQDSQHQYLQENYGTGSFLKRLRRPRLRLRIAEDNCLVRNLTVPATRRGQARQIAALQGRTGLPFEPDQVVCDHAITGIKDGLTSLTTIIVKRDIIERQLGVLTQAGCRLHIIDAKKSDGEGYEVNLLESSGRRDIWALAIPLLLITALLFVLTTLQLEWNKRADALAELDTKIANLKAKVDAVLKKSAEVNAVSDAVTLLRRKRVIEPPIVEIWDELTRTMPDTAWVSQLQATKGKVSISGFATEAAPLIGVLEQEPLFKQVAFTNPVNFDPGAGAERFGITFELDLAGPTGARLEQKVPH